MTPLGADSMDRPVSPSNPDVFDVSDSLAPPRVSKAASTTTLTFDGLLKDPLRLKEDLKDGCGGQLWPAGIFLAKYLLGQHSSDLSGKTMSVFRLSPRVWPGDPGNTETLDFGC
jgi:hypothetical protein